jgi:hypothetical protein
MNDAIRVTCGECGATLKGSTKLIGHTVKCPKCQSPVTIQAPPPVATAADPLAADPFAADPLAADPLASAPPPKSVASSQICPHCHAQVPAAATKCRHCGEFVSAAAVSKASTAALPESAMKMNPVEYVMAVLLAPLGLGIGMLWAVQKFPKARMMLLISAPMTVLFGAGVLAYIAYNPGNVGGPPPKADVASSPFGDDWDGGERGSSGSSSPGRDEPAIARPPTEEDLKNQPPHIQRAMRANVRLIVANRMLGSGVVVELKDNVVKILTNRHVIDEAFATSEGSQETPLDSMQTVNVTYVTGAEEPGKVIWVAPNRVDLAVVRAICSETGVVAATWSDSARVIQGESVFAVGNPVGLGWTLTRGTVSALRSHETRAGGATIPVIQTDAAITHGNSGGGLYNGNGELIGINNFIINPRLANNTGFAIRFTLLNTMKDVPFSLSGQ